MLAYRQGIKKEEFVSEMKRHQVLDAFVKGTYEKREEGKAFRGCAVGCGIESINRLKGKSLSNSSHRDLSENLGIPFWLARVQDTIFEGVGAERVKTWPVEFAEALRPGRNYERTLRPFLVIVVKSTLKDFDHKKSPDVAKAVKKVIRLLKNGGTKKQLLEARQEARNAAAYAADAAAAAAYAADAAAAYAAAYAADAAADAAWSTAREKRYEYFADELLKLLKKKR